MTTGFWSGAWTVETASAWEWLCKSH